jgi:hypothetical protein
MHDDHRMRTTLDIDDDVLSAVKELAEMRRKTAGQLISELVRDALIPRRHYKERNGVPIIQRPPGTPRRIVTTADVRRLQEDDHER